MSFPKTLTMVLFVAGGGGAVVCGAGRLCHPVVSTAEAAGDPATTGKTATLEIKGMTCASCGVAVKRALKKVDGFKTAEVSAKHGRAVVIYDPAKTDAEALAAAVTKLGYEAKPIAEPISSEPAK